MPLSYSQPMGDWYGNFSGGMKFFIRSSAASMPISSAKRSVMRSMAWTASVTRNEQR